MADRFRRTVAKYLYLHLPPKCLGVQIIQHRPWKLRTQKQAPLNVSSISSHPTAHIHSHKPVNQPGQLPHPYPHVTKINKAYPALSFPRLRKLLMPLIDLPLDLHLSLLLQQDQLDGIINLSDRSEGRDGDEGRCVVCFAGAGGRGL